MINWFLRHINLSEITLCCDNIANTAGSHYLNFLNQPMAIRSSSGFSHLRPGAFHMFYKYTTDITYITESGKKKNKQALTWVSPKRKKGEIWALFWDFCASVTITSVYPSEIPTQPPGTLTPPFALADALGGVMVCKLD